MARIMYSAPLVEAKIDRLKYEVALLTKTPKLKVILVGQNRSSLAYVGNKQRKALEVGCEFELIQLSEDVNKETFLQAVKEHAEDESCTGLIIQLPLPPQLKDIDLTKLVPAQKDVDGFSWENIQELYYRKNDELSLVPCTPKGILDLLNYYEQPVHGKNIVIIGRSFIVGKPLALLLESHNATVTLCHSHTKDLERLTQKADIIISAIGSPEFFDSSYLSTHRNQVLIDVGITSADGKWKGDFNFNECLNQSKMITPVPGGVGPMTVISLIENLIIAAKKQGY